MIDDKALCIFKTSVNDFLFTIDVERMVNFLKNNKTKNPKDVFLQNEIKDKKIKEDLESVNKFVENFCKTQYAQLVESEFKLTTWVREPELIVWNTGTSLSGHIDGLERIEKPDITIGALIYLNDNYEGGEINFPEYDIIIKPKFGELVIFPCHFLHEVKEVIKGERYTLPLFYTFRCTEWINHNV
jgi:predicted 2-oxoglutarate/Fe(II)-dependent dioxygenase YbiX